jgi:hypothetical protein
MSWHWLLAPFGLLAVAAILWDLIASAEMEES